VGIKKVAMPTRITQIERPETERPALEVIGQNGDQPDSSDTENLAIDAEGVPTVFKVEGTLYLSDAELLEKICRDVCNQTERPVSLELAGLSYLNSDSAAVLCRMKREQGVRLEGLHLFIGKVVELAEECEKATKYLPKVDDAPQALETNNEVKK
jgi:anti-anti-sigma regulatory factor